MRSFDLNKKKAVCSSNYRLLSTSLSLGFSIGDKVWVEDKDSAWISGDVLDSPGNKVHVETSTGKQVLVSSEKLFRRDPEEEERNGVDDMTN
ncbi:hypothetical protein Bca52824_026458 [Brassica carinata]|uniref:Myosin N-terminal SH3-like domain-containing protein n=1 Tax=Brassica carinata TaxID=52824 RepID=A0A8X7SHR0_BRACI|nr:hypothetical protein Bca52824_026458 [Brassica carinata]